MLRPGFIAAALLIASPVLAAPAQDLRLPLPPTEPVTDRQPGEVLFTGARMKRGVLVYRDAQARNLELYDQVAAFQGAWSPDWPQAALRETKNAVPERIVEAMRDKARRHVFWMLACRTLAEGLKASGIDAEASRRHRAAYALAKDRALRAAKEYKDADRSAFNRFGAHLYPATYDPERWSQGLP